MPQGSFFSEEELAFAEKFEDSVVLNDHGDPITLYGAPHAVFGAPVFSDNKDVGQGLSDREQAECERVHLDIRNPLVIGDGRGVVMAEELERLSRELGFDLDEAVMDLGWCCNGEEKFYQSFDEVSPDAHCEAAYVINMFEFCHLAEENGYDGFNFWVLPAGTPEMAGTFDGKYAMVYAPVSIDQAYDVETLKAYEAKAQEPSLVQRRTETSYGMSL